VSANNMTFTGGAASATVRDGAVRANSMTFTGGAASATVRDGAVRANNMTFTGGAASATVRDGAVSANNVTFTGGAASATVREGAVSGTNFRLTERNMALQGEVTRLQGLLTSLTRAQLQGLSEEDVRRLLSGGRNDALPTVPLAPAADVQLSRLDTLLPTQAAPRADVGADDECRRMGAGVGRGEQGADRGLGARMAGS